MHLCQAVIWKNNDLLFGFVDQQDSLSHYLVNEADIHNL